MSDFLKSLIEKKAREIDPEAIKALGFDTVEDFLRVEDSIEGPAKFAIGHPIEILRSFRRQWPAEDDKMTWAEWDPEVIIKHAQGKFGDINDVMRHKIWALQVAITTDAPWQDFDIFENTCIAFSGGIPTFGLIEQIDLHELAFGLGCLDKIRDDEWSSDVLGYIAATLVNNGMIAMPEGCPLPDVRNDILRITDSEHHPLVLKAVRAWADGKRGGEDDTNPVDVLLEKFELVDNWYKLGAEL